MDDTIQPYAISVPDDDLKDLKKRLGSARWPEPEAVDDWTQGVPIDWLKDICEYWSKGYDWREREAALNRFEHFSTPIDGLDIHFIHQRSSHAEAKPLLITHGWP